MAVTGIRRWRRNISLHSDNALGGPESRKSAPGGKEYESYIHEQKLVPAAEQNVIYGVRFLWNSFDFGSTTRNEGNAQDINTKGNRDPLNHKYRKDPYFFYKANWDDDRQPLSHQLQPFIYRGEPTGSPMCVVYSQRAQDPRCK